MSIVGVGLDLVTISDFAEQLERSGTEFLRNFTPGERRDCEGRTSDRARHFAARWAAKEAVIKAWEGGYFARRPAIAAASPAEIEVVTDAWGRPAIRLSGEVARELTDVRIHLSLTHDGDVAAAVAVIETDR